MTITAPNPPIHTYKGTARLRLKDGDRITVELNMVKVDDTRTRTTVDHVEVTKYWTISFTGDVYVRYSSSPYGCGQISDMLPERHPLRKAWERYHLIDMQSHCAHQDRSVKWDEVPPCVYVDGEGNDKTYRCGTKWLVELVDDSVIADLIALMDSYA